MTYEECLEYIHSVSWTFCKPGLERIGELCERLGHPERKLKFVHVAGTNGKGSFCSMLSSVLAAAGYNVGLYTSPYIKVFNERMQVNGENISNDELSELTEYIRPIADSMQDSPTEFELITAVAFEYFYRHNCDIVVLEAGMGGRLDSTNIIQSAELSVITGIALDHTAFLGNTVSEIAAEKAGIIKHGTPVLFGGSDTDAARVIYARACEAQSDFYSVDYTKLVIESADLSGTRFSFGDERELEISLLGAYQPRNAAVVVTAVQLLRKRGWEISDAALRAGLRTACWSGRFELIFDNPPVIFDGAHNPQGIASALESIKLYFKDEKVWLFTGVLRDKDYSMIAADLSTVAQRAFVVTPDSPRALAASEYAEVLSSVGINVEFSDNIKDTFEHAVSEAKKQGKPLVCLGSLYLYASLFG